MRPSWYPDFVPASINYEIDRWEIDAFDPSKSLMAEVNRAFIESDGFTVTFVLSSGKAFTEMRVLPAVKGRLVAYGPGDAFVRAEDDDDNPVTISLNHVAAVIVHDY